MNWSVLHKSGLAGCALALALGVTACADTSNTADDMNREDSTAAARADNDRAVNRDDTERPITVVGCLQETGGITGSYILAQNSSSAPVGTGGSKDIAGAHVDAAMKSYRLDGDGDRMKDLVGKQVRVVGKVTEESDVAHSAPRTGSATDPAPRGSAAEERKDIDAGDLAEIEVASIEKVAEMCGANAGARR
jgi:hypothetical protein